MEALNLSPATPSKILPIIKAELTEELYRNFPISILTTLLISTTLFWELSTIPHSILLFYWYSTICSILTIRFILMYWYRFSVKRKKKIFLHYYLFIIGSTITAPLWGILGSVLMPSDLPHQFFVLIIMSGVLAGSIQSLAASFFANCIYILLTLMPIMIWVIFQIQYGMSIYIGILVTIILYCLYSIITARRNFLLLINNIDLRNLLKKQATHDFLTTLFNRLYLEEYLKLEIFRSERNKDNITLMIIDIDHFKKFNSAHGNLLGDVILKKISVFLKEKIRAGDLACR